MSRAPVIVAVCVCILGVAFGLLIPLDAFNRPSHRHDDSPLILPSGELPRTEVVIDLLRKQRFGDLEKIYGLTLATDQSSSTDPRTRFAAFAYADPALQEFLDAWVAARESSPLPLIARGEYHLHLAYTVRGDGFRSETSDDQFKQIQSFLALAARDFQRAIEVGPPSVAAYQGLIDIAVTNAQQHEAEGLLKRALAATDNPLPLHLAFMRGLQAKWGGSRGAILDYWDNLRRSGTLRNRNQYLDFVGIILEAEEACSVDDCDRAAAHYEEAVNLQPGRRGMLGHAQALWALERHEEAMDVVETGLQHDPDSADHYEFKAISLWDEARRQDARAAIQEALKLDPYNPDLLMTSKAIADELAEEKQQAGDVPGVQRLRQEGERALEKAMVYGAPRAGVQFAWAQMILAKGGPPNEAYAAFKEAMRLAPNEPDYVLAYGNALAAVNNCDALQTYRRFGRMCKKGGYCSQYVSLDILANPLEEQCENPEKARRKRMLQSTLEKMEVCKTDFEEAPVDAALSQCTERAKSGSAAAAYDLGVIYSSGYGVGVDHRSAVRWLEVAAGQGHPRAKAALGNFVYQGTGTEKETERGLRLLQEAAQGGEVTAMFALGFIYYEGRNDDRDLQESKRWFSEAAALGSEEARKALHRFFDKAENNG